jgi:hypothetical protein
MTSPVRACTSEPNGLDVAVQEDIVVLTLRGHLDAAVGGAVAAATEQAVTQQARRLDIDLREVSSFTVEGAAALRTCRSRAAGLREGLHYRTGRGPGRNALLAAYPPAAPEG